MKKCTLFLVLLVTLITLTSIACAGSQDFTLVNATGVTLVDIRVDPSNQKDWSENLLRSALYNGESLDITFSGYSSSVTSWDLAAVSDSGASLVWQGLLLNNIHTIKLLSDGTAELH